MFSLQGVVDEEQLEVLLEKMQIRVSNKDKWMLEKPISLAEIHEVASTMGKKKVHGPHGVPLEFILMVWKVIGILPFEALNHGIMQKKVW